MSNPNKGRASSFGIQSLTLGLALRLRCQFQVFWSYRGRRRPASSLLRSSDTTVLFASWKYWRMTGQFFWGILHIDNKNCSTKKFKDCKTRSWRWVQGRIVHLLVFDFLLLSIFHHAGSPRVLLLVLLLVRALLFLLHFRNFRPLFFAARGFSGLSSHPFFLTFLISPFLFLFHSLHGGAQGFHSIFGLLCANSMAPRAAAHNCPFWNSNPASLACVAAFSCLSPSVSWFSRLPPLLNLQQWQHPPFSLPLSSTLKGRWWTGISDPIAVSTAPRHCSQLLHRSCHGPQLSRCLLAMGFGPNGRRPRCSHHGHHHLGLRHISTVAMVVTPTVRHAVRQACRRTMQKGGGPPKKRAKKWQRSVQQSMSCFVPLPPKKNLQNLKSHRAGVRPSYN